jgi:hypothetical protein
MTLRSAALASLVVALAFGGALESTSGCAPASAQATAPVPEGQREIAETHKARCGNCHVRVEPGTRTRAQLEAAFARHRARVHLSEADWGWMVDYLAAPAGG